MNDANRYASLHYADLSTWSLVHSEGGPAKELPPHVKWLARREHDGLLGVLLTEPLDAETTQALDGRVYALAGTFALVKSVVNGFVPRGLEMLVLRGGNATDLDALAETTALDRITGLAVLDGPDRSPSLARLLARLLPTLTSLSIFDATDALVRTLPETLLARLKTIRIEGRVGRPTSIDLTHVLGGDRRATTTLDLTHLHLDTASTAAWARGDWSGLERLRVHSCTVEAAALALELAALRELRSTANYPPSPRSLDDAAVAAIALTSPRLEIVSLEGSDAGDEAAFALAEHGHPLRYLSFDKSRVGSAGAIALGASVVLDRLEFFQLDAQLSFDAAHALADSRVAAIRQNANAPYRGLATVRSWSPTPKATAEATPAPEPTIKRLAGRPLPSVPGADTSVRARSASTRAGIPHAFRWQRYEDCGSCGGHIPWDGCPAHTELVIHPIARGNAPPTPAARAWVLAHGALMTRVEELGRQMLRAMTSWGKYAGEVRVTWWLLDHEHRGHDAPPYAGPRGFDAIIDAVGRPPFATTASWAHACARARARDYPDLPDPFTPARAIADLGISIIGLDADDGLLLALRTT